MLMQPLEPRRLFVADVWDGLLMVDGTSLDDRISVLPDPMGIAVQEGSARRVFPSSIIDRIRINGYGGRDIITVSVNKPATLSGHGGNDVLTGGPAADVLYGGDDDDIVQGNGANDWCFGDAGNDTVIGGDGNDSLRGGIGNDKLVGAYGNDNLGGEDGNDQLFGGLESMFTTYVLPAGQTDDDVLSGNSGNDLLRGGHGIDWLFGHGGQDQLHGESDGDFLYGGDDSDQLFGGPGADSMRGENGDDVLMDIGGGQSDSMLGGSGEDNFWLDAESSELIFDSVEPVQNIHRVASYYNLKVSGTSFGAPSREAYGPDLVDPLTTDGAPYRDFSNRPLFPLAGPSQNDVKQGQIGDCYFVASISAMARQRQHSIRQRVADVGDGTYVVQFRRDGQNHFVRVDNDLPTFFPASVGFPYYAKLGAQGSMWVAIMEKAFAFFRQNKGTYQSIHGGWPADVFRSFGLSPSSFDPGTSASSWEAVASRLAARQAVTACTDGGAGVLEGNHCYMVHGVIRNSAGVITRIMFRNPWGTDGAGGDAFNDGYVTIDVADAGRAITKITSAAV